MQTDKQKEWLHVFAGASKGVFGGVSVASTSTAGMALGGRDALSVLDRPANARLMAVCVDEEGMFCATGARLTVVSGDADGLAALCTSEDQRDCLCAVVRFQGLLAAQAAKGLFAAPGGALVSLNSSPAPGLAGSEPSKAWVFHGSIGEDELPSLEKGQRTEWFCPENMS